MNNIGNLYSERNDEEKDYEVLRADNELKELLIKRKTTFIWLIVIALGFTIALCLNVYNRLQNLAEVLSKKFREMPPDKAY